MTESLRGPTLERSANKCSASRRCADHERLRRSCCEGAAASEPCLLALFALFACLLCSFVRVRIVCVFPSVGAVRHLDKSEPSAVVFYCFPCVPVRPCRLCSHQFRALGVARSCICSCPALPVVFYALLFLSCTNILRLSDVLFGNTMKHRNVRFRLATYWTSLVVLGDSFCPYVCYVHSSKSISISFRRLYKCINL